MLRDSITVVCYRLTPFTCLAMYVKIIPGENRENAKWRAIKWQNIIQVEDVKRIKNH